ncbi:TolB-like translocation protein [Ekhidna sp.]
MKKVYPFLILFVTLCFSAVAQDGKSPMDDLPDYISQLTHFGQRADWSHDGKRILFIEKTFGDVFEVEVSSGKIRPMTHHFFHEGFVRALYLSNGDILLSGSKNFDSNDPWKSRDARNTELWVLKSDLKSPPTPLGVHCKEGPAVSRTKMKIAWALGSSIYTGEITYDGGKPKLKNWKPLFQSADLPSPAKGWDLETQNFRPNSENELIFYAFGGNFGFQAEVLGYDMEKRVFINYSKSESTYDEAEGTFPDGLSLLVESNRHRPKYKGMKEFLTLDLYKMKMDESGEVERITYFNDNPEYKASNGVISDDGRYMAFQYAHAEDPAGKGRGILILDLQKWERKKGKR